MLYLDYTREAGEWVPNRYGGRENLEAIEFLQELNEVELRPRAGAIVRRRGVDRVARRDTPDARGRARLHFKWNMGWMHDTLAYFAAGSGPPPLTTTS